MSNAKTAPQEPKPREEVIRLGKELYEREIRRKVEDDHSGEIISIDVESGDWEIGKSVVATTDRLWERRPEASTSTRSRSETKCCIALAVGPC